MTYKEAIKMLEYLATDTVGTLAGHKGDYAEFLVRVVDSLDMAIAVLREQDADNICEGCRWLAARHQRCSCCRRNIYMKDNYEEASKQ